MATCISSLNTWCVCVCSKFLARKRQSIVFLGFAFVVAFTIYAEYTVLRQYLQKPFAKSATEQDILENIRKYPRLLPNSTEVSIVTAYFNLGALNKWNDEGQYTPGLYRRWMSTFARVDNPVVVFADTQETIQHFRKLRAHYPASRTTAILVKRSDLWAFQLENKIETIFSQDGYPYHPPNTVNPLYSCAMHAKYELVQKVVLEELYQTRFIAWLDIGYFKDEVDKDRTIHLTVPTDFNRSRVAYSQVEKFQIMTPRAIIRLNKIWIAGGAFLATPERMHIYCSQYRRAVQKLLDMNLMSTDQQVIYIMFQPMFNFNPSFKLQTYNKSSVSEPWFALGYQMMEAPDSAPELWN